MKTMIKRILLIVLTLIFIQSLNVNAQTIERKVISSGGINYQSANLNVTSTIGETFITTIGNSGLILTQGFQQPVPYSCPFVLNNGNDTIAACGTSYSLDAGAGYSSYSWSNGSTSQTATVTSTGWYKCTVTQGSCSATDSVFVSLVDGNILNNDTIICNGSTVLLKSALANSQDSVLIDQFTMTVSSYYSHFSPILQTGKTYRLIVNGRYGFADGWSHNDAAWNYAWDISTQTKVNCNGTQDAQEDIRWVYNNVGNFQRPDNNIDNNSSFCSGSDKTYYWTLLGNNQQSHFEWIDGAYGDNSGSLNFKIYELTNYYNANILWSTGATTTNISVTPTQTTTYYCTVSNGISSCTDSVTVTVNPTSTSSYTTTACDSYQWNGNTYTSSGTYTYTTTNTVGCDSVATLNLSITPSTINTTSITSCGYYTWIVNGQTYAQSGTYSSLSNCHTEILNLTVLPVPSMPVLACYQTASFNTSSCSWDITGSQPTQPTLACYETANFNATTCTWDVTGVQPTQPSLACYETANFNITTCTWDVTGSPAAPIITTDIGCDTYTWTANGQVYTQSGTYTYSANCQDYTLNLTITNSIVYYQDQDFDGYGNGAVVSNSCSGVPIGYILGAGDCNDNNANINPAVNEICDNGIDDDCDGLMDEGCICVNPPTANAGTNITVCAGTTISLNGTIGGSASNGVWTSNGTGTFSPSANVLNATYNPSALDYSTGSIILTLTTNASAPCVSAASSITINFNPQPSSTGPITGPTALCLPGSLSYTYSVNPLVGVASYNWILPNGVFVQGSSNGSSIQVKFIDAFVHLGIVGNVMVYPNTTSGCGSSLPTILPIQVHNAAPVTTPSISGPMAACPGDLTIYSISNVNRAMNYTWTLPTGAQQISGGTTNIIGVLYNNNFTGGVISVTASNVCGVGTARTRGVVPNVLSAPSRIIGPIDGLCGLTNVTYSVPAVNGAVDYIWNVPNGVSITSVSNSHTISVDFNSSFTSGNITCAARNSCGVGSLRSVAVKALPAIPSIVTGPTSICVSSTVNYSITTVAGAVSYLWTVPGGAVINTGQGTKNINITYGTIASASGIITVKASNNCGISNVRVLSVVSINCPRIGNSSGLLININPNPTSGILNIESNELIKRIELFDMLGKLVMTYGNEKQIDISNLQSGLYLIRFTSENGVEQTRVEVSR